VLFLRCVATIRNHKPITTTHLGKKKCPGTIKIFTWNSLGDWSVRSIFSGIDQLLTARSEGFLEVDMTKAFVEAIDQPKSGMPSSGIPYPSIRTEKSLISARDLHGVVLASSFMVFFPVGAVIIHHGNFKNAFAFHWILQLAFSLICILTVVISLRYTGGGATVSLERH